MASLLDWFRGTSMLLTRFLVAITFGLAFVAPASAANGRYASVNDLKIYYEIQGTGKPLVLLPGGLCTIDVCLGKIRPALSKTWKTIAIEQQVHGHAADIDRPLTHEQMAEDTGALLQQLGIKNADFVGYSIGGVALQIAIRHPELVRKLVVIGTNYSKDGLIPGLLDNFRTMKPADIPKPFHDAYVKVAPHPEKWPILVSKVMKMGLDAEGWTPDEMRSVKAPTLGMIADADIVRPEHAVEMFRLIPHAQLAVLPLSDHFAVMQRPAWITSMVKAFLDAPTPQTK